MKTLYKLILTTIFSFGLVNLSAQDVITKKDKSEIRGKVIEIGLEEIKYIPEESPNGPVITLDKTEVRKIKYQNGGDWISAPDPYSTSTATEVRDKTRSIKFEFFSPLFGKLAFGYEQVIKVGINAEIKLGIIGPSVDNDISDKDPSGVFVKIGPKFLLGSEYRVRGQSYTHPLMGKYFKPEIIFSTFKQNYLIENSWYQNTTPVNAGRYKTTAFAICLNFGKQYILGNIMTLDWYIGAGYGFQTTDYDEIAKKLYGSAYNNDETIEYCYSHSYLGKNFPMAIQAGLTIGVLAR